MFFDVENDEIRLVLENNLIYYNETDKIKKELLYLLNNEKLDDNKSQYLILIEKCSDCNIEQNNNKLKILYFNLLIKNNLIEYITNNNNNEIKTYNMKLILKYDIVYNENMIDKNIINNNIEDDIIDNNNDKNEIDNLIDNLTPISNEK